MNRKERLYVAMGGCVGAVVTMVVCSILPRPLGAQNQLDSNFGKITCMVLEVVRPDGSRMVQIASDPHGRVVPCMTMQRRLWAYMRGVAT